MDPFIRQLIKCALVLCHGSIEIGSHRMCLGAIVRVNAPGIISAVLLLQRFPLVTLACLLAHYLLPEGLDLVVSFQIFRFRWFDSVPVAAFGDLSLL